MRISVFGLGYVGCVTAVSLARMGHEVAGVDIDEDKVRMINDAVPPVVEDGLKEALSDAVAERRLWATGSTREAVHQTDLAFICVGTPGLPNGRLNVQAVERVGAEIGIALRDCRKAYDVVLRSTVLPGTAQTVLVPALEAGGEFPARVAVNPEFMREGSALRDFAEPPLTLVGSEDPEIVSVLRLVYAGVEAPFVHTSPRTAEIAKYVSNAFHALKICFANEIGDVCDALGADAQEVMRIFMMDRKLNISPAYLRPGFAFGGSCLPKDVRALVYAGKSSDLSLPLLSSMLPSNEEQIRRWVEAVLATRKRRIGVVGLSFKPGTDDLRESPLVALIERLIGKGCDLQILDRNVSLARLVGANRRYIEEEIPHIASLMCDNVEALLQHSEVVVIGNASEEASEAAKRAGERQIVIDLTRGAIK
jgi:GDP-mannose 6-dehydrogenase